MIITNLDTIDRYRYFSKNMAIACDFLKTLDLTTVIPGDYQLSEGGRYSCLDYLADGVPGKQFENHHHWLDIHFVTQNCERMATSSLAQTKVIQPYDAQHDIALFTGQPEQVVTLYPGNALITFPEDLHQPKVHLNDKTVRKVCMKVKL